MHTVTLRILKLAALLLIINLGSCYSKPKKPKVKVYKAIVATSLQRKKLKGILQDATDSSIFILSGKQRIGIPSSTVEKLIIKRKGNVGRGAVTGLASGVALGLLIGFGSGDDTCEPLYWQGLRINCYAPTKEEKALIGGMMFGIGGTIIGTIVGTVKRAEKILINGNQAAFDSNLYIIKQYTLSRP